MYLNKDRISVYDWNGHSKSLCPDCGDELGARMGECNIWHWYHLSNTQGCYNEESKWHLSWKQIYNKFSDWEIEYPITINGKTFRIDSANPKTGRFREFVHTLSPSYLNKHKTIKTSGYDILWVMNGDRFQSAFANFYNNKAKALLKPKARLLHDDLLPNVIVHFSDTNEVYKYWKYAIWYKQENRIAQNFNEID